MLNNHAEYKYETTYKGPFMITQCYTNGEFVLHYGVKKIRYNIRRIKPYTSDANIKDIKYLELMVGKFTLRKYQLYTCVFTLNLGTKYYNWVQMGKLTDIHIHILNLRGVLMKMSFSSI